MRITALICCFGLWLTSSPGQPRVTIGQNFTGISYGDYNTNSSALPPDCNGEVGPNHYVEFINGMFVVYNKSDGSVAELKTDSDFWGSAGVGVPNPNTSFGGISDPRIIYDPASQRWFASQIDINPIVDFTTLTVMLGTNHFLLAVSKTSDPSGQWKGAAFDSDPDETHFADFPTLGVDSQGVYLAADMFDASDDPSSDNDTGCSLVAFAKADLLGATPNFSRPSWFPNMSFSQRGQVFQPATCLDGSSVGTVLAAQDIGTDSSPYSNLVAFAVQNVSTPGGATLSSSTFIRVLPYMVPDNPDLGAPALTVLQPDGSQTLMANDARFSAKTRVVGGVLYGVHNTELNGRIAIRWYRINATNNILLESGTLANPNLDLFFPSIAANESGVVVIGYNASGGATNAYVSCFAVAGQTINGVTTFGQPLLLQAGSFSYQGDDEDPTGLVGAPVSRWGDYSATSVDPSDHNRFWTVQMFPSDTNVWSTQITELITVPGVILNAQAAGPNIVLSWPTAFAAYQLQSATDVTATAVWTNVSQSPQTNANLLSVTLPHSARRQFFRLHSQL